MVIPNGPEMDDFVDKFVLSVVSPDVLAGRIYEELLYLSTNTEQNVTPFVRLANLAGSLFMRESLTPALDIHPILSLLVSVTDKIVRGGDISEPDRVLTLQNLFVIHGQVLRFLFSVGVTNCQLANLPGRCLRALRTACLRSGEFVARII